MSRERGSRWRVRGRGTGFAHHQRPSPLPNGPNTGPPDGPMSAEIAAWLEGKTQDKTQARPRQPEEDRLPPRTHRGRARHRFEAFDTSLDAATPVDVVAEACGAPAAIPRFTSRGPRHRAGDPTPSPGRAQCPLRRDGPAPSGPPP